MQDEIAILDRVAKATFETIECQHCTVFRVEGETLVVVASRGNRAWSLPLGLERERKGVAGWVADQGQSALVDDTVVDGRFDPNWSPGQPDPRSLIDVPVHLAGSPYAIISVEHDRIRAFDAHDRQLVETLATQAAQALRNTWLIDGLNQVGQKALRRIKSFARQSSTRLSADPLPRGLLASRSGGIQHKLLSSHMKVLGQNMPRIGLSTLRPVLWVKLLELQNVPTSSISKKILGCLKKPRQRLIYVGGSHS